LQELLCTYVLLRKRQKISSALMPCIEGLSVVSFSVGGCEVLTQPSQSLAQIGGPGLRVALGLLQAPAAVALSVSMTYYAYDAEKVPWVLFYRA